MLGSLAWSCLLLLCLVEDVLSPWSGDYQFTGRLSAVNNFIQSASKFACM